MTVKKDGRGEDWKTVSKTVLVKLLRHRGGAHMGLSPSAQIPSLTEINWRGGPH